MTVLLDGLNLFKLNLFKLYKRLRLKNLNKNNYAFIVVFLLSYLILKYKFNKLRIIRIAYNPMRARSDKKFQMLCNLFLAIAFFTAIVFAFKIFCSIYLHQIFAISISFAICINFAFKRQADYQKKSYGNVHTNLQILLPSDIYKQSLQ